MSPEVETLSMWVVTVMFDADGTKQVDLRGHRVSSQLWDSGRCHVRAFDAEDRLVDSFQAPRCISIRTVRADARPESGRERSPEPAACGCPITLETARVTRHSRECSVRQAAERFEAGVEDERPAECCCAGCIGMGPCDDDLGKADDDASDDLGLNSGDCCDGETGTPGVDCDCSMVWRP